MIDEKKLIEDIEKEFDGVCVYDVSPSQAVNDFVEIVDRQPEVGQWIPCSERLPEDGQTVIFTAKEVVDDDGSKFVEAGVYDAKKGWCYNDSYFPNAFTFVAWMPLPEPYKEENNGQKHESEKENA